MHARVGSFWVFKNELAPLVSAEIAKDTADQKAAISPRFIFIAKVSERRVSSIPFLNLTTFVLWECFGNAVPKENLKTQFRWFGTHRKWTLSCACGLFVYQDDGLLWKQWVLWQRASLEKLCYTLETKFTLPFLGKVTIITAKVIKWSILRIHRSSWLV